MEGVNEVEEEMEEEEEEEDDDDDDGDVDPADEMGSDLDTDGISHSQDISCNSITIDTAYREWNRE